MAGAASPFGCIGQNEEHLSVGAGNSWLLLGRRMLMRSSSGPGPRKRYVANVLTSVSFGG